MKVPSPGESITEVEIAQWLVSDGDFVEKDQAIAEVDSDKATLELPAENSGIITLKAEEGDVVAVGDVVCLIDTDAEKPAGFEAKEEAVVLLLLDASSITWCSSVECCSDKLAKEKAAHSFICSTSITSTICSVIFS